jgi:alpha-tubulin suppressor-like RCC1 family protein
MICSACRPRHATAVATSIVRTSKRFKSTGARPPGRNWPQLLGFAAFGAGTVGAFQYYNYLKTQNVQPAAPAVVEALPEKARRKASSKEDNRDLISSQHLQVKKSWEDPGVFIWGSNTGKVASPGSKEKFVKTPRWLPAFEGVLLRDLKLDRQSGAAIDAKGDMLQWGRGYSGDDDQAQPTTTLAGKDLKSLCMSRDRVIALGADGSVYSLPVSREEQQGGTKADQSSWLPFWSSNTSNLSFRYLQPKNLPFGERVSSIAGGLEHVLLLTNRGRVFAAASGSEDFPSKGQLGVPGLTWTSRPPGSYDQPHEISTLKGFNIQSIAAGDHHSLALDKDGRLFTFGDNSYGQLGLDYSADSNIVDAPSLVPVQRLYSGAGAVPKVTYIAGGGNNSYFTVDATRVATADDDARSRARLGTVTSDTFACGHGIWGTLGNGRWTHVQNTPAKIPALSGLFEYDEANRRAIPIRLAHISAGATHAAAVMDNVTYLNAASGGKGGENDTNWGADIVFWGNNEFYQLGNGKRNNSSTPVYISSLYQEAEKQFRPGEQHRFHITPKTKVKVGGKMVEMEQRIECGRGVTAVYSGV